MYQSFRATGQGITTMKVRTEQVGENASKVSLQVEIQIQFSQTSIHKTAGKLQLNFCNAIAQLIGAQFITDNITATNSVYKIQFWGLNTVVSESSFDAPDDGEPIFEPATVLIVDDMDLSRRHIFELLRDTSLKILTANSGKQAVELSRKYLPDLILLDTNMPGIDGYRTHELIKNYAPTAHCKTIAMTASLLGKEMKKIEAYRFDGILRKPIHQKELMEVLTRFLPYDYRQASSLKPR